MMFFLTVSCISRIVGNKTSLPLCKSFVMNGPISAYILTYTFTYLIKLVRSGRGCYYNINCMNWSNNSNNYC